MLGAVFSKLAPKSVVQRSLEMACKSSSVIMIVMVLMMSFVLVPALPAIAVGPPSIIKIESNEDLSDKALLYGWPGDGSASHPYIIANLNLANEFDDVVTISSTSHLVIENCTVSGDDFGIDIMSAANVTVRNNTITADVGVALLNSENCVICGNTITYSGGIGVYVADTSSHNTILNNTINGAGTGVYLCYPSSRTTVSNNTITGTQVGIGIQDSDHNLVCNNTVEDAVTYGIDLYHVSDGYICANNTVTNNIISCANIGINLQNSNNNTLSYNTAAGGVCGVQLQGSNGILVCHNILTGDGFSENIELLYSDHCIISNNTLTGGQESILLSHAHDNTISGNTIDNAYEYSIDLEFSNSTVICHNTFTNSVFNQAIFVYYSDHCIISNNTLSYAQPDPDTDSTSGIEMDGDGAYLDCNHLTNCLIILSFGDDSNDDRSSITDTTITSTNTVNGQPVYFFKNTNMNNATVPSDAGEVLLFNITYANVTGLNNVYGGVFAIYSAHITVIDNMIADGPVAVYLVGSENCSIINNDITDPTGCGIVLADSEDNIVSGNTVSSTGPIEMGCILMDRSDNNNVSRNHLTGGGFGPRGPGSGLSTDDSLGGKMSAGLLLMESNQNRFSGNVLDGGSIMVMESSANLFDHNTVVASPLGLTLTDSDSNILSYNTIHDSTMYGIDIEDGSGNVIYANVLTGNNGANSTYNASNIQAMDDSDNNFWNDTSMGNFWGDWQSPDIEPADGIVDVPYAIDGGAGAQDDLPMIMVEVPLSVSIDTPTPGYYSDTSNVDVTWTVSDAQAIVEISTDGTAWTNVTGTDSHVLTLNDGSYTLHIRATDGNGQVNTSSVTFSVDTVKPSLSITSPVSGSWHNTTSLNVTWAANDERDRLDHFWVSLDNGQWVSASNGYLVLNGLSVGLHSVAVRAYDLAGNFNDAISVFSVDTVGPALTIVTPSQGAQLNSSALAVSWSSTGSAGIADYWVSIDGGAWTDMGQATSHAFVSIADGSHSVTVMCEDRAGNWNETSAYFNIDATAPTVTEHSPIGIDVSRDATVGASFSERMNESSVNMVVNGISGTLVWSGNSVTFTPVVDTGVRHGYTVVITGKDLSVTPSNTPGPSQR